MSKSKARYLAELLAPNGVVKEDRSALDISGGLISIDELPTITDAKISSADNWNTAYGWGDHSLGGYLTSYTVTENDVTAHEQALTITESQISDLGNYLVGSSTPGGSITGSFDNVSVQYGTAYSGIPVQGSFFFDSINQRLKVYTGSDFVDAVPDPSAGGGGEATDANTTFRKYIYTTSSETNAVTGGDDNSQTLSYVTDGTENIEAFVNGVKVVEGTDYVATTGTSVAFTYNIPAGSTVEIQVYELLTNDAYYLKSETYSQSEVQTVVADYLPLSGGTLTGGITSSGNLSAANGLGVIRGNSLENHLSESDTAETATNYYGFANGSAYFRNFSIFDGKQSLVTRFIGSTKLLDHRGTLNIAENINFPNTSFNSNFPSHYYSQHFPNSTNVYIHAYPYAYDHSNGASAFNWRASDGVSAYKLMKFSGSDGTLSASNISNSAGSAKILSNGVVRYGNSTTSIGHLSYGTGLITLEAQSTNTSIAIKPSGTGNVSVGGNTASQKLQVHGNSHTNGVVSSGSDTLSSKTRGAFSGHISANGMGMYGINVEGGVFRNAYYDGSTYRFLNGTNQSASRIYFGSSNSFIFDTSSTVGDEDEAFSFQTVANVSNEGIRTGVFSANQNFIHSYAGGGYKLSRYGVGDKFFVHSGGAGDDVNALYINSEAAWSKTQFKGTLGITDLPKDWNTLNAVLQVGKAAVTNYNTNAIIGANWYYSSGDKYNSDGYASIYKQENGSHIWYSNGPGIANDGFLPEEKMRLNVAGYLTVKNQPGFQCYCPNLYPLVQNSNTIGGTWTARFNNGSHFNTSNGTFTAPVQGLYHFSFHAFLKTISGGRLDSYIMSNGSNVARTENQKFATNTANATSPHLSVTLYLQENDVISFGVHCPDSTGYLYNVQNPWGYASGHLIG